MDGLSDPVRTHTHTLYRHTVGTQWQISIIASMWTLTHRSTLTHIASTTTAIPHSLHLSVSVTTRGLYSGIPYTTIAQKKKKKVAWKSSTLSENTTIHLPPSLRSLVTPALFPFHLLFVSPHFSPSQVFSGAAQMERCSGEPYPFVLCLPIQLHGHLGILEFRLVSFHCANYANVRLWFSDNTRGDYFKREYNYGSLFLKQTKKNFYFI